MFKRMCLLSAISALIFCLTGFQASVLGDEVANITITEVASRVVEDGGTGPHSAIMVSDITLDTHTIFRPKDLTAFDKNSKLPIIAWGNGACANSPWEHINFLSEVASHGFLVIAIGPMPAEGQRGGGRSTSSQLIDAIDWAIAQNADKKSQYYDKIDITKIAVSGMSCGGLQALETAPDPRVTTAVICNSGIIGGGGGMPGMPGLNKEHLKKLHTPVMYLLGGEEDIAYGNGMDDFKRINHVPVFAANLNVGHGGTYSRPHGGDFAIVATAWFQWQLKDDKNAAKMFTDDPCGVAKMPGWVVDKKNFGDIVITPDDVTAEKVGSSISADKIGEPVSVVNLSAPKWVAGSGPTNAYAVVEGAIMPVDPASKPINFRVILPAQWSRRAIQQGGAGMNGMITVNGLTRPGFAMYGSDSGHSGFGFGGGGSDWALNDEAVKNFAYMQMKKTHDAAMVIMERVYGQKPLYNYYIGGSQGGREALTVAQRYPADYDGVIADVPIVSLSTLMLAPELIRIQEKPIANWVTPAKTNAIRAEFMRQCDKLDGLEDGVINNYVAARQLFDVTDGVGTTDPWAALRAPEGVDPNPQDRSTSAKLTDGQIETLHFVYSRYKFATPLAHGKMTFGMWVPNTDVSGSGLIEANRFKGQEGAPDNARVHSHMGVLGVTGFLMQNLNANPLDYVEGGKYNDRRILLSEWFDSTNPDLSAFYKRGGKMIVTIGTNDTLASPGAQMDYYQSVIDKMGQDTVDDFARFFVIPQGGHGLSGSSASVNGAGENIQPTPIPNQFDKFSYLQNWVEKNQAPGKTLEVKAGNRSLPLCSYPNYPKYIGGPTNEASSYISTKP